MFFYLETVIINDTSNVSKETNIVHIFQYQYEKMKYSIFLILYFSYIFSVISICKFSQVFSIQKERFT